MKNNNSFLFALLILTISACSKKDDTPAPAPTGSSEITIESPWQYSVNIGGTTYSNKTGVNDFQGNFSWSASLSTPPDSSQTTFSSGLLNNNSLNFAFDIELGTIYFSGNRVEENKFISFIHTGNYLYSNGAANGIIVGWIDGNGQFWSTDKGVGTQTGSLFTITDVKPLGLVFSNYEIKFKAKFNCILYNDITGQSMTLTDGVYVGVFENFN